MATLTFILFFFWAAAMLLSVWACEVARRFARRIAKAAIAPPVHPPNPPAVALIVPIKGIEEDTAENIRALLRLTYPRLRFLFSVETEEDPVLPLLKQLTHALAEDKCDIIIAGQSTSRGQKIHNQLAAVARTSSADEVLVFMDADAQPHDHWLTALVSPLDAPNVGAATGYRLYVPAVKHSAAHLASGSRFPSSTLPPSPRLLGTGGPQPGVGRLHGRHAEKFLRPGHPRRLAACSVRRLRSHAPAQACSQENHPLRSLLLRALHRPLQLALLL